MFIGSALPFHWHRFWRNFYQLIIKDCLDNEEKEKLRKKISYHEKKMIRS